MLKKTQTWVFITVVLLILSVFLVNPLIASMIPFSTIILFIVFLQNRKKKNSKLPTNSVNNTKQSKENDYTVKSVSDSEKIIIPVTEQNYLAYSKVRKLVPDFTVLDFETTGFNPQEDSIIQVAAVKYRNFEKVDEFFTFVNPIIEIPSKITKINGISDDDVDEAPYISNVLPDLIKFLEGETIVAHNASFDMKFLLTNIDEYEFPYIKYRVIDTLSLARKHINSTPNHKLITLKRFLKLNQFKSHNALHDCYVTAELYKYCYEKNLVAK